MMLKAHRFKLRRIAALMLVMAMLVANMPPGKAVVSDVIANDNPDLTAIVVATDKASKVEIGFSVKSGAGSFKAAAMVLKYDAKLLTPIDWEQTPLPIPINEITNVAGTTVEEKKLSLVDNKKLANDPWSVATNVKAMSSPDFSVREAKAFVDATAKDGAKVGYLCLNAMMPRSAVVNLPLPGEIPVTPGNPDAIPPVAPVNQPSVSLTPQGGTTPSKTPNGLIKLMDAEPQKTAVNQAVVARFEVNIDTNTGKPYTLEQVTASIDIVNDAKDDAILGAGDPLKAVAKTSPTSDASGAWYLRDDATPEALTTVTKIDPYLLSVPKGASINEGGGTPDGFAAVTFYDWDDTLLGSIVVPKNADATEQVKAFEVAKSATDAQLKDPIANDGDFFYADAQLPLTNKKGYSFLTWLPYSSELLTHCGRALDYGNTKTVIDEPTAAQRQDFTNLQSNIAVKACYKDNTDMLYPAYAKDMYYMARISEYNRVGNSTNYAITAEVCREVTGKGVPRMGLPTLKVTSSTQAGSIINFYPIGNGDKITFVFYPSTAVTAVTITVVDFFGATNKAAASNKTATTRENQGTGTGMDGFLWKGTINMINDALAYNNLKLLSLGVLKSQGNLDVSGFTAVQVQQSLRTAWLTQNSEDGKETGIKPESQWIDLDYDQMTYAIKNNGSLIPAKKK